MLWFHWIHSKYHVQTVYLPTCLKRLLICSIHISWRVQLVQKGKCYILVNCRNTDYWEMIGNLGNIRGWRDRFLLKSENKNRNKVSHMKFLCGKIVGNSLIRGLDLYYWNYCMNLISRKFLKYFPSWWKLRVTFISVKFGLLAWIVVMPDLSGRWIQEVLSVFSPDYGAQGPTGVHCSSWSYTNNCFQRQTFWKKGWYMGKSWPNMDVGCNQSFHRRTGIQDFLHLPRLHLPCSVGSTRLTFTECLSTFYILVYPPVKQEEWEIFGGNFKENALIMS